MADAEGDMILTRGGGSTPRPDPTVLTSAALTREIASLRELMEARIDGRQSVVDTHFADMERAMVLLQTIADRIPDQIDRRVGSLDGVINQRFATMDEKFRGNETHFQEQFRGIQVQFLERGVREEEKATLLQTALAAALQAQKESAGTQTQTFKEAIAESKAATTKQIDALGDLLRSTSSALNNKLDINQQNTDGKISDLKERLQAIESLGVGRNSAITDQRSSASETRGYILLGFSAISVLLAVVVFILSH